MHTFHMSVNNTMCFQISYRVFGIDIISAILDEPERSFDTGISSSCLFMVSYCRPTVKMSLLQFHPHVSILTA